MFEIERVARFFELTGDGTRLRSMSIRQLETLLENLKSSSDEEWKAYVKYILSAKRRRGS